MALRVRRLLLGLAVALPMGSPALSQGVDQERALSARLQSQVLELQEEIRRLTGRLEEAEFAQRRTEERLDRLIGDVDLRLRNLEGEGAADTAGVTVLRPQDAPAATGPTISPLPAQSAAPAPTATPTPATTAPRPSEQAGVLGTIPRDALLGLERPGEGVPAGAVPVVRGDADTRYQAIQALLAESDTASARPALQGFLNDFPDAPQAPQASFMLGETWFLDGEYADAAAQFADNYRSYGDADPRAPDNLLKLGMSLARLGDADRACTAFIEFERRYPQANTALQQMAERERRSAACP